MEMDLNFQHIKEWVFTQVKMPVKPTSIPKKIDIGNAMAASIGGKAHVFDATMSREEVSKKVDDLFGW